LVATHLAIRSIIDGDCEQALVVAAGLDYPQAGYLHLPGGVQSASGHCRPFDEHADGVVGGSGVACVLLRPLSALSEKDVTPYGVILGTAVNNDGAAKVGYYAPSPAGQAAVIGAALDTAGVEADTIGYLEAHGTGTRLGDPVEWSAASRALAGRGVRKNRVAVGAVKANIGHLDAAAGLAGLIKALLVVRHAVIPPVAGFTAPSPLLEQDGSPLYIPAVATPWSGPVPRRASVSAFGIGGTNAHMVVEAPPESLPSAGGAPTRERLVVLSAAEPAALQRTATRLADHLLADRPDLADVCLTLATGRPALAARLAVIASGSAEAAERLRSGAGVVRGERPVNGAPPLAFLFPGQGSQRPGMALPYRRVLPGFGAALGRCLDAFPPDLAGHLHRALLDSGFPADELEETVYAQPALFAVGWAAATALVDIGVRPVVLAGHSLGEITAACVAGALDLTTAANLVAARGEAMQACPVGAMLAVGCDGESILRLLDTLGLDLDLASDNGPDSCVVAGTVDAVDTLRRHLDGRYYTRRLRTTRAFHSRLIEPAVAPLARALEKVEPRPLSLPLVSDLDGRLLRAGTVLSPSMFLDQARLPVRLAAVLSSIAAAAPSAVVLDLGPGRSLAAVAEATGRRAVALSDARPFDGEPVLAALGALWTLGHDIKLATWSRDGRRTRLPGYSFAESRWSALADPPAIAPAAVPGATRGEDRGPSPAHPRAVLDNAWRELLGHDDLTDESDFFHLGGDSLIITRLARRLAVELGIRVPVRSMLARRTLGRQADLLAEILREHRPEQ
jgi:phthiocerol/phenolphthiocerol synthesis type-I polyketide synthase E